MFRKVNRQINSGCSAKSTDKQTKGVPKSQPTNKLRVSEKSTDKQTEGVPKSKPKNKLNVFRKVNRQTNSGCSEKPTDTQTQAGCSENSIDKHTQGVPKSQTTTKLLIPFPFRGQLNVVKSFFEPFLPENIQNISCEGHTVIYQGNIERPHGN